MTVNYTTLLGLAKPVTGTEQGDWGDVVNDEITTLLEDAVANSVSISVTAGDPPALTDTNGATNQARMSTLIITGSPGVTRNIVAPSRAKIYQVINQSNGAVVIKGTSTTGVTIAAGATGTVAWNGSDFIEIGSTSSGRTFNGNVTVNGVITAQAAATQDAVKLQGRAGGSSSYAVTITPTTLTANRTITAPDTALTLAGIDVAQTFTAVQTFTPAARTSGAASYFTLTTPADTGQTASTESIGASFTAATRTWATGSLTLQRERVFGAPEYAFAGASTLTTAINVDIGTPTAGSNANITNAWALRSGPSLFVGNVRAEAAATQDAVVVAGRAGGTSSYAVTITPTTLAANRTFTLPDATTVAAGLAVSQTFTGIQTFTPDARTSGANPYFVVTMPTDTGQTAGTESIGVSYTAGTRTWAGGTLALQRERVFAAPTYAFGGVSTLTTAINVDIATPAAGANATITNAYALRAGASLLTEAVTLSATIQNIALGTSQTTGNFTIGGTSQSGTIDIGGTAATGAITLDQSTKAHTLNIGSGATENATTKTINIGTGGVSGSTTTMTIGSANGTTITLNGTVTAATFNSTTIDTTNLEVTNIKAKDGTASMSIADSTGAVSISTNLTIGDASGDTLTINGTAVSTPNGLNFDSDTLVIDAANNRVGVGTNAPSYPFHVYGNSDVTSVSAAIQNAGTSDVGLRFIRGSTGLGFIGNGSFVVSGGSATDWGMTATNNMVFAINAVEKMRLGSAVGGVGALGIGYTSLTSVGDSGLAVLGNVGIGTSSPTQKLTVNGVVASIGPATALTASSAFFDYNTTLNLGRFAAVGNTTGTAAPIYFSQYSSNASVGRDAMIIDSSGNLGLGVTPTAGLDVGRYSTAWTNATYPYPAGNVFVSMVGVSGANNWFGIRGAYGASTGSANLLLQANFNDVSQNAGNYIGSEATGVASMALTFGKLIGGASSGANAAKSEMMRLDASGNLGVGTTSPSTFSAYTKLSVLNGIAIGVDASNAGRIVGATTTGTELSYLTLGGNYNLGSTGDIAMATTGAKPILFGTNSTERARITSGGDFVVGPSGGNGNGVVKASDAGSGFTNQPGSNLLLKGGDGSGAGSSYVAIFTAPGGSSGTTPSVSVERVRITYGGYFKASNTGTYVGSTGTYHELRSNANETSVIVQNTSATLTQSVNGIQINYSGASPNSTSASFLYCNDSTALRAEIRSDGGLANYSANNVNLASDERLKKDISSLASTWDKLKTIEVVNFRYKDCNEGDPLLYGVIAQQVQPIVPDLVVVTKNAQEAIEAKDAVLDADGNVVEPAVAAKEATPEYYGIREQPMYWLAIKALQEAMARIETLEAKIAVLESKGA